MKKYNVLVTLTLNKEIDIDAANDTEAMDNAIEKALSDLGSNPIAKSGFYVYVDRNKTKIIDSYDK